MSDEHPFASAEGVTEISPWMPEQDRIRLAVLGKLIEECNELSARAARCIIHGLDEVDPDTGRTNDAELAREMADVSAAMGTLYQTFSTPVMPARIENKKTGFLKWHDLIRKALGQ